MSKINNTRPSCKDVYKAFLVENAYFDSVYEIPMLSPVQSEIPHHLVLYSDKNLNPNTDSWICFYEDDYKINSFWNNPKKYLRILSQYGGVITPDYSLYRDMPFIMQIWNIYRSRALGVWLQDNGIKVIPNVRFGDERTFEVACSGIEKGSTISLSTHGLMKITQEKDLFKKGLAYIVNRLTPKTIIVYGTTPKDVFEPYRSKGIQIIGFESKISQVHKRGVA